MVRYPSRITFAPPPLPEETDPNILALRARFARVSRLADLRAFLQRLPRKLLPWAWCFAVGTWAVVILAIFAF